ERASGRKRLKIKSVPAPRTKPPPAQLAGGVSCGSRRTPGLRKVNGRLAESHQDTLPSAQKINGRAINLADKPRPAWPADMRPHDVRERCTERRRAEREHRTSGRAEQQALAPMMQTFLFDDRGETWDAKSPGL